MATSKSDIKTKIADLRHEILSYKPVKDVPRDDELVFPDQLVIGVIDIYPTGYNIAPALRSAIHGDVEAIKYAERGKASTKGQEKYLTDSISVIERAGQFFRLDTIKQVQKDVKDLAARVACFVVLAQPENPNYNKTVIKKIKEITDHYPIVGLRDFSKEDIELERKRMWEEGIVEVHEIPRSARSFSDTEQLQLLNLLHGCLREGDVILADIPKELSRNPKYGFLYENAKKEITEAKQKMTEEIRRRERVEESLQHEMKKLQMNFEESSARCESFVEENARLKNEIVCEKEKREQAELAMAENDKMAKNSQEMYKQSEAELQEALKAKEQKIAAQEDKFKEKEETARCEVEQIKKEREEERAKSAQLKKEVETNQHRVSSLAKLVEEKEHDKVTLKQQVNRLETEIEERTRLEKEKLSVESALKKELKSRVERIEQLERETWKLRTKIQLESEIRSEEQKKKTETSQWSFIPWMSSGKQTHPGTSLSEDPSSESSGESDVMQVGEEPPNDAFADILKQIADDLSDEAKIDSLGGQLGILQGDIDRALKTNMRYEQITSRGTYYMLKQWRRGVSREDERIELRRALEAARLINIADRYLPQEGSTGSEHSKKAEDPHLLSGGNGTASEQGSPEESPKHRVDDEQYSPEDIMTSGEDAAELTGTDQPKLEDPHGQSGKDGTPLAQGSPGSTGWTEAAKTTATIDHFSPDDTSNKNKEENECVSQQSEESSTKSTANVQDTSEDMPSGEKSVEKSNEETNTSAETQVEGFTTKLDDLVSSLSFSNAFAEKLYVLFFAKVIIDIRQKALQV